MTTGKLLVAPMLASDARQLVAERHYLRRKPPVSYAFGLYQDVAVVGVITFGIPASHHMLLSACPTDTKKVIELNRLWVTDAMPRNTESWFIARALNLLPAKIVLSYADTSFGHAGYVYRAANFFYAGYTDMERKTPRFDYVVEGKHSRDAFRCGKFERVRRKPKMKYWTVTGNRREQRELKRLCTWPVLDYREVYPK